jgi:drug/metabolite transporter (DMT)-like permease
MVESSLAFSLMSVCVKIAGRSLPIQEIVLFRAVFTLVVSYLMLRRASVSVWGKRRGLLLLRGAVGYVALSAVFYSVAHLPLAEAVTIQYLHPLFTAVVAAVVLRERVGALLAVALFTGFAGVLCVAQPSIWATGVAHVVPFAFGVAVVGAFLTAVAYVIVRSLAATEHPLTIVFYFPFVAVPASLPAVLQHFVPPSTVEWMALIGVGTFAQIGQVRLTRGLALEPAARATALSYLQVLFAAIWGITLFDEVPSAWTVAGAALILAGSLAATARARDVPGASSAR